MPTVVTDPEVWRLAADVAQKKPSSRAVQAVLRAFRQRCGAKRLRGGPTLAKDILERARHIHHVREERAGRHHGRDLQTVPVIERWPVQRHDRTLKDRVWYGKLRRAMDALPQEDFR